LKKLAVAISKFDRLPQPFFTRALRTEVWQVAGLMENET
jgi:hypothetical protein